ncbi:RadC family protein [Candidatus Nanohalobium constans]|uniref:DNA repair protein RadC n=1 Tax=Candidatus Nanohalobium constans TaxID=2565781 RepID=A0A5Q0UHD3_9ARCH|nr:DNA repair protein RadC [Candidatus Nanohalobium constans]QGA80771.1 DNA repair protein RadC [Candidatus Nanohalobium constans]
MDYTVKELPESERPREKLEERGVSALSDVELLSIIIRTGIQGKNVKELSGEILDEVSLDGLADRSLDELKDFDGISRVKAGQLLAAGELGRRMKRTEKERIESFSDVESQVEDMKFLESERARVFYLNSGNEIVAEKEFDGSVSSVDLEMREIFEEGLRSNASALILAHNHPSGKADATEEDLEFTKELINLGEKLDIGILDHTVVGDDITSLRKSSALWK